MQINGRVREYRCSIDAEMLFSAPLIRKKANPDSCLEHRK